MIVDFSPETLSTHGHLVSKGRRREAQGEHSAVELHGGCEAADEVACELTVDCLDTQFIGEIILIKPPQSSLKIIVDCSVGLHV
jgi:hypothetical protein